jgi:hypothetical protein
MSKKGNPIRPLFHALLLAVSSLLLLECSVGIHEEVYSLASAKARFVANVVITPNAVGEYAFTADAIPTVTIDCATDGAQAYYSFDGAPYRLYTAPLSLPITDLLADQTIRLTAYSAHPDYANSSPVTQVYRFAATRVPTPTITAISAPYYRYNVPPAVTVSCSLPGATVWYSTDGGANYIESTGPFELPVPDLPDWDENRTIVVTAYATAPNYIDSTAEERSFTFYGQGAIVTIAGTGIAGNPIEGEDARTQPIEKPAAIYVDDEKNVYFTTNSCVWKIAAGTNEITRLAGLPGVTGWVSDPVDARTACLANPSGLAGDDAANQLYIASSGVHQILRVPYGGGQITRVLGKPNGTAYMAGDSTTAPDAGIIYPTEILFSGGTLYFSETGRHVVRSLDEVNALTTVAGTPAEYGFDPTHLYRPLGLCLFGGRLYIADSSNNYIRAVVPSGSNLTDVKSVYENPVQIRHEGSNLYYMYQESGHNIIVRYDGTTATPVAGSTAPSASAEGSLATDVELRSISGFFIVPQDGIYIADWGSYRVRKVILY